MSKTDPHKKSANLTGGRAFIDVLNAVEDALDPASFSYGPFNYWPVLRFAINYQRKMGPPDTPKHLVALTRSQKAQLWLNAYVRQKGRHHPDWAAHATATFDGDGLDALPQADVLYLNRSRQYLHATPGETIQPFTDGLRQMTEASGVTALTLTDGDPREEGENFVVPTTVLPERRRFKTISLNNPTIYADLSLQTAVLKRIRAVNAFLQKTAPTLCVDEAEILFRMERISAMMHYYGRILDLVAPKVVFLSSYTGAHFICAAAKPRGITVVDIQHGSMHAHHPLAANWHRVPDGGYALLPDIFWCWTERTAAYVNATLPPHHHGVVGGNPKATRERLLAPDTGPSPSRSDRPQILLALQYGADDLVKPHVLEAYARTRDRADWHFRMHPMGWARKEEALALLEVSEAALTATSRAPLHQQLPRMDLLLTNMSTIVHEALEYGARAAVCTAQGAATFDDLIEAGDIAYAPDTEAVLGQIDALGSGSGAGSATGTHAIQSVEAAKTEIETTYAQILAKAGLSGS